MVWLDSSVRLAGYSVINVRLRGILAWALFAHRSHIFLCACILVSFRTLTRSKHALLGWDDYLMLFALVGPSVQRESLVPAFH